MLPYFTEKFGNAASRNHRFGWEAKAAVDCAREECASAIGADPREIIFTSGATESINLLIKGVATSRGNGEIISNTAEHPAVLDTLASLEKRGLRVRLLPVDSFGMVSPRQVADAISDATILVSAMFANNEIGTINPIAEIGTVCHERGVLFHCDATQAVGKLPMRLGELPVDLLSFSAHKFYGPKGIGVAYVRRRKPRIQVAAQIHGGGHERELRSGTLNVPAIVGIGRAISIAVQSMNDESARIAALRNLLQTGLESNISGARLNGHPVDRLPGNLNMSFPCAEGEALMMSVNEIAVSSGSACTSAKIKPSHVLRAIGLNDELVHSSIRFGIGRFNTEEEIDYAVRRFSEEVARLRLLSPKWNS